MAYLQTLETVKFIQLEKYNNAKSDHEREQIELNPKTVFHNAVENCKPILILQNVKRGGVIYQVGNNINLVHRSEIARNFCEVWKGLTHDGFVCEGADSLPR